MRSVPTIAIVGGGFSGSLLATHLARRAADRLRIVLIDRRGSRGRGLAYSTGNPSHLLNVRADNMSAFPEAPGHFRDWLERRTGKRVDPVAFVSRSLYGTYIEEILAEAGTRAGGQIAITHLAADCVGIRAHGAWRLSLSDAREIEADAVALCLGHFPPRLPAFVEATLAGDPRVVVDPWDAARLSAVGADDRIAVIGSGLTMADVVVQLEDQGHRGEIIVVSRHGLMPNVHARRESWPAFIDPGDPPTTALALLRRVRREARRAEGEGVDWRAVVDSLRPVTAPIWRALPLVEQKRALRHLRAYWDVHRHRIAPEIDARLRDGFRPAN